MLGYVLFALVSLPGCEDRKPKRPPAQEVTLAPLPKDAKTYFAERCVTCHGAGGEGDGPSGRNLQPWPRNLTNAEWQAKTTDEQIRKVIVGGGASVGKSAAMPANPELADKPEIVQGLVEIVRAFGKR